MEYVFWIIFCGLAAWFGDSRKLGPWWTLLISVLLSPLVGFIVAAISGKKIIDANQV